LRRIYGEEVIVQHGLRTLLFVALSAAYVGQTDVRARSTILHRTAAKDLESVRSGKKAALASTDPLAVHRHFGPELIGSRHFTVTTSLWAISNPALRLSAAPYGVSPLFPPAPFSSSGANKAPPPRI
jgi:hypothetical protein